MVRRLNGRLPWLARVRRGCVAGARARPPLAQSTGYGPRRRQGRGRQAGRRREGQHRRRGEQPPFRHQVRQEGRVPADRPARPARTRSPPRKTRSCRRRATSPSRIAAGEPITLVLGGGAGGGASPEAAAKNAALKKTFEEGVDREPRRQPRRGDRQLSGGGRTEPELLRLLLQHRVLRVAEEGLGQGRSRVQEGDRAQGRLRRGLQRPRQRLQRARASSTRRRRPAPRRWS